MQHIENVCKAGIDWVQFRMKTTDESIFFETAQKAQQICKTYGAVFIVNDQVQVAKDLAADGVHLGQGDMQLEKARKLLGAEKIIGATANTLQEIAKLPFEKINYIGLGPFAFSETKKNLSPVLGLSGYQKICPLVQGIPLIAVGGIREKDLPALLKTGVYGVAVSGLLSGTQEAVQNISKIIFNEFHTFAPSFIHKK